MEAPKLKGSVKRVHDTLVAGGWRADLRRVDPSAKTSEGAAAEVGCTVAQIAKSLVFKAADSGKAVLVVASGANTVDPARVEALIGEATERADAAFVRQATGFAIGGVAPLGHTAAIVAAIDEDLLQFDEIWAAGGAPDVVFPLDPRALPAMTGGVVGRVKA
ncbi:MAG: YbaK/EbsC family protein [Rhodovibrio sp.]|nr:YbaK/EbsC family protein [Rhodovibrio sp.]